MTKVFIVDAFSEGPGTGNPAAVVLLDRRRDSDWMTAVAAELNQPATAFVTDAVDERYPLRWFSPAVELPLCGHGTLAAAHVLHHERGERSPQFATMRGSISASSSPQGVELDFPASSPQPSTPPPGLLEALGLGAANIASCDDTMIVEVDSPETVAACRPDLEAEAFGVLRSVVITAAGGHDVDITSRVFAPKAGIPEDHATGSAHCLLTSFWSGRLDKTTLDARQASPRGGKLQVELRGDRVALRGRARTVLTGRLLL
ncbi:MAG TPA: PhzF family phenazine biosynthesis protein [Acidimicrobiia bacterium]|jgi:predicted PhzF superfamily epimerase YddE/YHI9